jgi:hypothetical protein
MKKKNFIYCLLFIFIFSCRDHYESPVKKPASGYLVVEGSINSGKGGTSIKLSRMNDLNQRTIVYVKGAVVQVESDNNQVFPLTDNGNGVYSSAQLTLDNTRKYRLRIKLTGNKEYASTFAQAKATPPIDSITWKQQNNGVQISVSTHDPKNETRYYRWEYQQTWEIRSWYQPALQYKKIPLPIGFWYTVEYRDPINFRLDTTKYRCWQGNASSSILLGSTAKLSKDVIQVPMIFIERRSIALSVLYSVQVKQFALSKEEYEFLDIMRKNTELTGSVFDPQPSQLKGNISCITDPAEPVIGYVGVSSLQEKRIFISNGEVPGWNYNPDCFQVEVQNVSDSVFEAMESGYEPTLAAQAFGRNNILSFFAAPAHCTDCTLMGGSNKKPDFWP